MLSSISNGGETYGLAEWQNGRRRGRLSYTRNAKVSQNPKRNGCLTPVKYFLPAEVACVGSKELRDVKNISGLKENVRGDYVEIDWLSDVFHVMVLVCDGQPDELPGHHC